MDFLKLTGKKHTLDCEVFQTIGRHCMHFLRLLYDCKVCSLEFGDFETFFSVLVTKKTFAGVGLAHGTTMRKSRRMMTCKVGSVEVGAGVEGQTRCDFLLKTTFQL